jgi:hypothetical protein
MRRTLIVPTVCTIVGIAAFLASSVSLYNAGVYADQTGTPGHITFPQVAGFVIGLGLSLTGIALMLAVLVDRIRNQ